ncbi:MAG: DUF4442 domain-containing protein [Myxococcales bacterium]|nr:DUF4442 domain-containing protein [Myxococcales bacterium]
MNLELLKATALLRAFGLAKIPMILYLSPSVVEASDSRIEVRIPLTYRSRNHLKSMYFGSLAVGADCACGLLAMRHIQKRSKTKISLVFKDFSAQFLKRPEDDVHFSCEMGPEIAELVEKTVTSGERCNLPLRVTATVPTRLGTEPVAQFVLTLSLKLQS